MARRSSETRFARRCGAGPQMTHRRDRPWSEAGRSQARPAQEKGRHRQRRRRRLRAAEARGTPVRCQGARPIHAHVRARAPPRRTPSPKPPALDVLPTVLGRGAHGLGLRRSPLRFIDRTVARLVSRCSESPSTPCRSASTGRKRRVPRRCRARTRRAGIPAVCWRPRRADARQHACEPP